VALADTDYLPRARQTVNRSKTFLTQRLTSLGFPVLPSSANFLLVPVGNGTIMRDQLLQRGLVVRDCTSFGLADCIRIGLRSQPDCERLAAAMAEAGSGPTSGRG
jgi:histidinol-phosphate/aromatic aminotransferase/cobyric acid decarboxylase-like protein